MKNLYKVVLGFAASAIMTSCTKSELLDYQVAKPASFANQEIIDSYQPLKTYLKPDPNSTFKFGIAGSIGDYLNKGVFYRLANSNFNEIVLGYEMKHGAVVRDDGTLHLDDVKNLLEAAKSNGLAVYGHTLCWHSNQNAKYLNSLIAPIVIPGQSTPTWDIVTEADFETNSNSNYEANPNAKLSFTAVGQGAGGTGRAIKITNDAVRANDWDAQFFFKFSPVVKVGEKYEFSMDVKADENASFPTQAHRAPYQYKHWDFFGNIPATSTWNKYVKTVTITQEMADCGAIAFNLGAKATSYYFDNFTLKKYNAKGSGNAGHAYFFTNQSVKDFWAVQVAHDLPTLQNNQEYTLKFAAKATAEGNIRAELQSSSDYSSNSFGSISLGLGWKEYELKVTTSASNRNRFVISFGDYAGTVYIDNVKLTAAGNTNNLISASDFESGAGEWVGWGDGSTRGLTAQGQGFGGALDQVIEKTPAEKKQLITGALNKFISGMVDTCKYYVKAWDVVNEPMDDGRPFELKTGIGKDKLGSDEFYWQDYMGRDYAVEAFRITRQHANQGDKLFINDYNLEYNLDKCRGLIEYVKYIESRGAHVDGIGTQMHIDINTSKENIAQMFTLLAATGKMIKVSELDMGLGGVKTADATEAHYKAQSDMYKYVIDKYFEIVPKAQQYGITIWSVTDQPENSFWRAGEPIGLWTEGYTRKPAYVGVAEGLRGK
ncbi:endo-1,4-beta-xylanase [Desertivirga brevis]|uniref:endo-1,4-beta-xylanase n=1 Tax=Desertivirga brevis TaxID=2810310 RepID=UPI001A95B23B|nr:endo-1,4-beta-xylanase [Pedobacter sp. SYSU D00873]